jgi:hypothetical protein
VAGFGATAFARFASQQGLTEPKLAKRAKAGEPSRNRTYNQTVMSGEQRHLGRLDLDDQIGAIGAHKFARYIAILFTHIHDFYGLSNGKARPKIFGPNHDHIPDHRKVANPVRVIMSTIFAGCVTNAAARHRVRTSRLLRLKSLSRLSQPKPLAASDGNSNGLGIFKLDAVGRDRGADVLFVNVKASWGHLRRPLAC